MSWELPDVSEFEGLDLSALDVGQAYLRINVEGVRDVFVYRRSDNCDKCPFVRDNEESVSSDGRILTLSSHFREFVRLRSNGQDLQVGHAEDDPDALCTSELSLGQYGVYDLNLASDSSCTSTTAMEPGQPWLSLLFMLIVLCMMWALVELILWLDAKSLLDSLKRSFRALQKRLGFEIEESVESETTAEGGKKRLRSLDVFRGVTIALMIFVNDGAGGYAHFEHATWNGLYLADVVFAWFMWIMGFCMPLAIRSVCRRRTPLPVSLWRVLERSVKLFVLGFVWGNAGWIDFDKVRIPGVLQRFGVVYFVVGSTLVILAHVAPKDIQEAEENTKSSNGRSKFRDLLIHWPRWIVALGCIALHTAIVYLLPVPNCPTGYVGPGGLHEDGAYSGECVGGATGYIDRLLLGSSHIYSNPTPKKVYDTMAFDPEGVLGCLSTCFQVFIGYQGGLVMITFKERSDRILRFLAWAMVTLVLGLALAGFSVNDGPVPINKNIWSLSYVLVTTGLAFLAILLFHVVVDEFNLWTGHPFLYAGMNSLLLYLGHSLFWQMFPFNFIWNPIRTHWWKLVESVWGVLAWMIVAYILYRKRIFFTV